MLSELWTKSSRLQNAQHFLKGGGLRGWNMRCPFSLGMRQKTVREKCIDDLGEMETLVGEGWGRCFIRGLSKRRGQNQDPRRCQRGEKPWVTRRACRPSGSPTSGRRAAPSLSLHHPDTQGASHWVSCWLCF